MCDFLRLAGQAVTVLASTLRLMMYNYAPAYNYAGAIKHDITALRWYHYPHPHQ